LRIKNQSEYYLQNDTHGNYLKIKLKGIERNVKWSYEDEWTEILREHRLKMINNVVQNKEKEYIFLKCEVEYIGGKYNQKGEW
jgi:hypothetical protein